MSPDSPEAEQEYNLTPRTEAKYSKIDEEFQMMMQRSQLNGSRVGVGVTGSNYNLPVSVPVGNYDQSLLQASPQMHTSISPRPSSSETDSGRSYYHFLVFTLKYFKRQQNLDSKNNVYWNYYDYVKRIIVHLVWAMIILLITAVTQKAG